MAGTDVRIRELYHAYGGRPVFDGLDAAIAPGRFVAVVGDSGSGKTTLLLLLAGLLVPARGRVEVDGRPADHADVSVGFVFQENVLFPWMTVRANVTFGRRARRRPDRDAVADRLLARVGLNGCGGKMPHELSGGMQQRAAVARCLANQATLMLMDEPFGSLDAANRRAMQDLLLEVWAQDRPTIVLVTHDVDEAILLADEVWSWRGSPVNSIVRHAVPFTRPRNRRVLASTKEYVELRAGLTDPAGGTPG